MIWTEHTCANDCYLGQSNLFGLASGDLAISGLRQVREQNEQPTKESAAYRLAPHLRERFPDYPVYTAFFAFLGRGERVGVGSVNLASASNARSIACLASSRYFFASSKGSVTCCSFFAGISDLRDKTSMSPETL